MKACAFQLKPHTQIPQNPHSTKPLKSSLPTNFHLRPNPNPATRAAIEPLKASHSLNPKPKSELSLTEDVTDEIPKWLMLGAASIGLALVFIGVDGQEALALGPEGPLMEEFWDNMRRYGLYILTVSTGAIYTIFQPIVKLLENPLSAVLLVLLLVGGFYLVSVVLSAMTGISDFSYDYGY